MIDLAPNHKRGLVAVNPVWLACGAVGYGEAIPKGLELAALGGVVVGPILAGSRGGSSPPRIAHSNGGFVLDTGLQNRGTKTVVQQFARLWPRLGCPVVAQVAEWHTPNVTKVAAKLCEQDALSGLELLLPPDADRTRVAALVRALERQCDLPIWVKTPLASAAELAQAAVEAGAVGVVIGQPAAGAAVRMIDGAPQIVRGGVFGPLAFAPMLEALLGVAVLQLPCALVACGGIHTAAQIRQALAAGAHAVQIDSAVWVEPGLPGRLAAEIAA